MKQAKIISLAKMSGIFVLMTAALLLLNIVAESAETGLQEANFILIVVPESDTTVTSSPRYRLSASTKPNSTVTINGKSLKVYPSGAFCDLMDLTVGENWFTITSRSEQGDTISKSFLIIRTKPIETTRPDSLLIEDIMMEPSTDLWLNEGDILKVQIKGTPNCKATFMDSIPMRELPISETNGIGGIYQGIYKVKATDLAKEIPISFRLEASPDSAAGRRRGSTGNTVTKQSSAKVSFMSKEFPVVGITKGERPFLNFGLGTDRLGGAKLAFINPGIKLAITGKAGNQYRVALSDNQVAWIPENFVDLLPSGTYPPFSLTGSWNVYGDDKYDYVTVSLNDKLPYASFQEIEPARIIIDIFGAVSNTNWITQQVTTREIKNVYYTQPEKNVFRIIIELRHKQLWGYKISYIGNNLVIRIKHQPEKLRFKNLTFIIDAGHGGSDNGALGSTGAKEKEINLATAYHLKRLLEAKGAKVVMTRESDTTILMSDRLKKILQSDADILISIHANSVGFSSNPEESKGVSTYYKYICYRPLSTAILTEILKTGISPFGNVGSFNFTLNSLTEIPNVLVELAFMSNPEDEMKLLDDDFRRTLAKRIRDGIEEFLDQCDE
ncbi:MAG: N-acetylmuramoyl-L-alanine amidase [Bacteroidota bacterium]